MKTNLSQVTSALISNTDLVIQPKLTIGAINDKYEQEADQIAAHVIQQLNSPNPGIAVVSRPTLIPESDRSIGLPTNPEFQTLVYQACTTDGETLEGSLQQQLETIMGANFCRVQLHHDSLSDSLNRALGSIAFTIGNHIFFRQDAYQPETQAGQELLIHELTHVIQQGGGSHDQGIGSSWYIQRHVTYGLGADAIGVEITVNKKYTEAKLVGKSGVITDKGPNKDKRWFVRLHGDDKNYRFKSEELDYAKVDGKSVEGLDEAQFPSKKYPGSINWFRGRLTINDEELYLEDESSPGRTPRNVVWIYKNDDKDEYPHILCEEWAGWMGKAHYTSAEVVMNATDTEVDHVNVRRVWFIWDQNERKFLPFQVAGGTGHDNNVESKDSTSILPNFEADSTDVRFMYDGGWRSHKVDRSTTHPAIPTAADLNAGWGHV
ncbi:DUF4157 domain-containing protein [Leptothoe sp. ISB3NOV94-8A]